MENLINALKAIADPTRVRLIMLLAKAELAVTDLTRIVSQSQPRVSRHLKILTEAELIERHKEGSWVFYRLPVAGPYSDLVRATLALSNATAETVARDFTRLEEILTRRAAHAQHYFDAHAKEWDEIRKLHIPETEVEKEVLRLIAAKPIHKLLDVGTGTGRMLEVLAPHVKHGIGIDNSREMLSLARTRLEANNIHHCQVRHADLYALPGEDENYDAIMFHQVLHFAEDPRAAISEAARVLSPNGRIIIVDFAPHNHDELRDKFEHRRLGFTDEQIMDYFTAAALKGTSIAHLTEGKLAVTIWLGQN
jgi:ubiquinone/menaquinone biosynthesis C-methylase UbiE/DNA-binding transcriptional ArsR family regulator